MTLHPGQPKWRRRKDARPSEIVAAAFAVFAEKGFAAARLDDIAARAGVSKGAVYLYFETKEALFRAVVRDSVAPNIRAVAAAAEAFDGPFGQLIRMLLPRAAMVIQGAGLGRVLKMVVAESRNFPELARAWHDDVISVGLGAVTRLIERAQARGEVRPGDPRVHAFSLIGPMITGVIWTETFAPVGAEPVDLPAVALQHVETVLGGLLLKPAESAA
jgi:AcrR family transcriptional regulator